MLAPPFELLVPFSGHSLAAFGIFRELRGPVSRPKKFFQNSARLSAAFGEVRDEMPICCPCRNDANGRHANPLAGRARRGRRVSATDFMDFTDGRNPCHLCHPCHPWHLWLNISLAITPLGRAAAGPLDTAAIRRHRLHQAAFDSQSTFPPQHAERRRKGTGLSRRFAGGAGGKQRSTTTNEHQPTNEQP